MYGIWLLTFLTTQDFDKQIFLSCTHEAQISLDSTILKIDVTPKSMKPLNCIKITKVAPFLSKLTQIWHKYTWIATWSHLKMIGLFKANFSQPICLINNTQITAVLFGLPWPHRRHCKRSNLNGACATLHSSQCAPDLLQWWLRGDGSPKRKQPRIAA